MSCTELNFKDYLLGREQDGDIMVEFSISKQHTSMLRFRLALIFVFVSVLATDVSAAEVYIGGGYSRRTIPGSGEIAWTADLSGGGFDPQFVGFDVNSPAEFTPELGIVASGFQGLGWDENSGSSGRLFLGIQLGERLGVQMGFGVVTSLESVSQSQVTLTPTYITDVIVSRYQHSSMSLEVRFYPLPNLMYFIAGFERTKSSLTMSILQAFQFNGSVMAFDYPLAGSKATVAPIVGIGVEKFLSHNIGAFVEVTNSFSEFENFDPSSPSPATWPFVAFDNGGLMASGGLVIKLRRTPRNK